MLRFYTVWRIYRAQAPKNLPKKKNSHKYLMLHIPFVYTSNLIGIFLQLHQQLNHPIMCIYRDPPTASMIQEAPICLLTTPVALSNKVKRTFCLAMYILTFLQYRGNIFSEISKPSRAIIIAISLISIKKSNLNMGSSSIKE